MTSTALDPAALVTPAAAPMIEILRGLPVADLDARTPCADFDVRALLQHLLTWGPVLEAAASKDAAAPSEPVTEDPVAAVAEQVAALVAAWREPAAWDGAATVGSPEPLPATMVGGMVMGELVVHGWDLGRAVGRRPTWDPAVLASVHAEVAATAAMGRQMGVYGPEVPVPAYAPLLDRLLGLTGRDPDWAI